MRTRAPLAIAAAAAAVAAVAAWAWWTPEALLRDRLVRWQFWTLELQWVALVVLSAHQIRRVAAESGATRRTWIALGAVGLACLLLTAAAAPRTPRILFDEQIYQAIGRSLADSRLALLCNDGTVEYGRLQCWNGEYNKQPNGFPYVLSLAYRAAGSAPWVGHAVNNVAAVASAAVAFLVVAVAFGQLRAALLAALVLTLIPMQLIWSNTSASEPTAALAIGLAVLAGFQFVRTRTTAALAWMMSAVVFAASFRPECLLIAPLVLVLVACLAGDELARPRFWWGVAAAAVIGWNVIAHSLAVRGESWGASGDRLGLAFLATNSSTNTWFYLGDERFPPLFTALAVLGLVRWWRSREAWVVAAWFGLFWGVFLFFYAGSYNYGADVRYSLMSYAPLAVLAGLGGATLLGWAERLGGARPMITVTGILLLVFHASTYAPLVRAVGEEAWGARADVEFIDRMAPALPRNAVVFTHVPSLLLLRGVNAAQTSIAALDASRVRDYTERYSGGLYLHWNFWCNVADPAQQAFCTAVLERFDHDLVAEERIRNYRFALYRLRSREPSGSRSAHP